MIEKPWYKKWWGILFILIGLGILANIATQQQSQVTQPIKKAEQSPKKTDTEILLEIENRMNEYQKKLKGYYPDDDMLRTLSEDHIKLTIVEAAYSKADDANQKKVFSKAKSLRPKVELLLREVFAKNMERSLLDKGITTDIQAKGNNKQILEYKYALMSKAVVYKLVNESYALETAKKAGFKKIVFTDGFNSSWTYDLTK